MSDYKFHPLFPAFFAGLAQGKMMLNFTSVEYDEILPMMPGCEWGKGDTVRKAKSDIPGPDITPIGTLGVILGGMAHPDEEDELYFVDFGKSGEAPFISACAKSKLEFVKKAEPKEKK